MKGCRGLLLLVVGVFLIAVASGGVTAIIHKSKPVITPFLRAGDFRLLGTGLRGLRVPLVPADQPVAVGAPQAREQACQRGPGVLPRAAVPG
jgi:hypothetical protein